MKGGVVYYSSHLLIIKWQDLTYKTNVWAFSRLSVKGKEEEV